MFTQLLSWIRRPAVGRTASMFAIAGMLLAGAPQPAEAHPGHQYVIDFMRLKVFIESDDYGDSDEPYVVAFVANLATSSTNAVRSDVLGDADKGESKWHTVRLFDGAIPNPDDVIIVVALMESDENVSRTETVRSNVEWELTNRFFDYKLSGFGRTEIVRRLDTDMYDVINKYKGGDDQIAYPQELRVTATDVATAHAQNRVAKFLDFWNGPAYRLYFEVARTPFVEVCQHGDWKGVCEKFFPGQQDPQLENNSIGNDRVTSVRVEGVSVALHEHPEYGGRCQVFGSSIAHLGGTYIGNDKASSLQVGVSCITPSPSTGEGWGGEIGRAHV